MPITRRDFLKSSAVAAAALTLPHPLFRGMAMAAPSDALFVLVQLEGGNDGLNTVVPIDGPQRTLYETARPNLQIPPASLLAIDDDPVTGDGLGLHPSLPELYQLYLQGRVAVVNGVGYTNQSLSHFRSEDIWFGGLSSAQPYVDGWFGRYLDGAFPGALVALDCDGTLVPAFFGENSNVLAVRNLSDFALPDDSLYPDLTAKKTALQAAYDDEAASTTGVQLTIGESGDTLLQKMDVYATVGTGWASNLDPVSGGLARRLKQVASVIRHDRGSPPQPAGARFFHVRLGGFDTHTNQGALSGRQATLFTQLSAALSAFYADMVALGVADRVLMMTFSEFGRRVAENGGAGTAGTDHGAASPVLVIGNSVVAASGGGHVFGRVPALDVLDGDGNLKYHTDFRAVYATVLSHWLGVDPVPILGGSFADVGFLA